MAFIEVDWPERGAPGATVKIDGKEMQHVTRIAVDLTVGKPPDITVAFIAVDGRVRIDDSGFELCPQAIVGELTSQRPKKHWDIPGQRESS